MSQIFKKVSTKKLHYYQKFINENEIVDLFNKH